MLQGVSLRDYTILESEHFFRTIVKVRSQPVDECALADARGSMNDNGLLRMSK